MKRSLGRHLPSIANLLALITVARTGSITKAADELHRTQSAISRQLKDLESFVGASLIDRSGTAIALTPQGRSYADSVESLLGQLEAETLALPGARDAVGPLTVTARTTFAVRWLIPRLARFSALYPEIIVNVETHTADLDLQKCKADLAIVFGSGHSKGWASDHLLDSISYPVCSPALVSDRQGDQREALLTLPLLHHRGSASDWQDYFELVGLSGKDATAGPTYTLFTMGLQAALGGLGIALLPQYLIAEELAAGRLVALSTQSLVRRDAYFVMVPESRAGSTPVASFRSWLLDQARP